MGDFLMFLNNPRVLMPMEKPFSKDSSDKVKVQTKVKPVDPPKPKVVSLPNDMDGDGISDLKEWFYDGIVLAFTLWAVTMLTLSWIELPNHGKINKGDTTYVATILGGGLTKFGMSLGQKKAAKK